MVSNGWEEESYDSTGQMGRVSNIQHPIFLFDMTVQKFIDVACNSNIIVQLSVTTDKTANIEHSVHSLRNVKVSTNNFYLD